MAYEIYSGVVSSGINVNTFDRMTIYNGGVANDTTVNGSNIGSGCMYISSGGMANGTTVNSKGSMTIYDGGIANSTTVNSRGSMTIYDGGIANGTTVNSGGCMYISSGGTATEILENGGYVDVADGTTVSFVSNTLNGIDISWNSMSVHKNTVINNATINSGGYVHVTRGGIANYTTIQNYSGTMHVTQSGTANNTTINRGGTLSVASGGIANNTIISSGAGLHVSDGGSANRITVNDVSRLSVSSGGTATKIVAMENARLDITVASNTYVQGVYNGSAFEMKNAQISSWTVNAGRDGARMDICSGGVANSTTLNGVRVNTTGATGQMHISCGGIANNTTVNWGGGMYISSGGVANSVSAIDGGATVQVLSGGVANEITAKGRHGGDYYMVYMYIDDGGVVNNTTVDYCSNMYISAGGTANNTTIDWIGTMYISSGGKHTGSMQFGSGGVVSAYRGSIIDFTVSEQKITDAYLINDFKLIKGEATFTITVNSNQQSGTYKLAQEVDKFLGNISIGDGNLEYGYATVNFDDLVYKGKSYSIDQVDGNLTLTVTSMVAAPVAFANITSATNKDVTVSATFGADSAKKEYSLDNKTWQTYTTGIKFTSNGSVYFRGQDANGYYSDVTTYTVNNIDKVAPTISVTGKVSGKNVVLTAKVSDNASGIKTTQYSFDNKTWVTGTSVTVTSKATVYFKTTDKAGNTASTSYVVKEIESEACSANLLSNGVSQIVAWDKEKGAVGYVATDGTPGNKWRGIWDWDGKDVELWRVVGVGRFAGSKVDHDGILLYNGIGNTFAAWTNLNNGDYGYVNLCHVEGNFNTKCLTDLANDDYDDVLIYDEKGSFGVVLDGATYKDIWHVDNPKTNAWQLCGAGNFGGDQDKLVVKNNSGHLYFWNNNDSTFKTWNWSQEVIGYVGNDFEFVGIGDFKGDGIDDILLRKTSDNGLWVWEDGNASKASWQVTPGNGFKVEAIGDYNGDGKDDVLVREYNTGWGGCGYYAFGGDTLWNDLNARIETDLESKFAVIA